MFPCRSVVCKIETVSRGPVSLPRKNGGIADTATTVPAHRRNCRRVWIIGNRKSRHRANRTQASMARINPPRNGGPRRGAKEPTVPNRPPPRSRRAGKPVKTQGPKRVIPTAPATHRQPSAADTPRNMMLDDLIIRFSIMIPFGFRSVIVVNNAASLRNQKNGKPPLLMVYEYNRLFRRCVK